MQIIQLKLHILSAHITLDYSSFVEKSNCEKGLLVSEAIVLKRSAAQWYLTPHAFDIYPICAHNCNNSFQFEFTFSYAIYGDRKKTHTLAPNWSANQMNAKQVLHF